MIQRYAVMHNDSPSEAQEGKSVHYWIGMHHILIFKHIGLMMFFR